MPKGEGSPSLLGADSLETRMLLSHLTGATTVHVASTISTSSATNVSVASKPELETGHATGTSSDVQERDDEQAAAAQASSSLAQEQFTIPLVLGTSLAQDSDESSNPNVSILMTNRSFRVSSGDEHVAWGGSGSTSVYPVIQFRSLSEITPEVPETFLDPQLANADTAGPRVEKLPEERPNPLAAQGADLLAPYLPFDRGGMEDAIDSLIGGLEILMGQGSDETETAELIPVPIACGIGLAGGEIVRRWIRRKREADEPLERDPALGLEGWPA